MNITRTCLAAALGVLAALSQAVAQPDQPHIVLIIADDLGWGDVGYNGSEIRTPNLNRLADQGVRLDRFYSQPYCTATRASLMTGQAAARMGIQRPFLASGESTLPLDLKILPEFLRDVGYETALSGKWHLGHARKESLPLARGFEQAYGSITGGLGYWDHVNSGGYDWHRNEVTLRQEGYATRLIADEAVRLIRERDKARPLFLYTAFSAPHLPNEAPEKTIEKYAQIDDEHRRVFAAMVDEMDQEIGRILLTLQQEGMADDTIVWFLSDNGATNAKYGRGWMSVAARYIEEYLGKPAPIELLEVIRTVGLDGGGDNGPYKGGKGSIQEGGVLVPSVVLWPDNFPSRPVSARITVHDMMPTLLSAAGAEPKPDQPVDGADQTALLRGEASREPADFLIERGEDAAYYMGDWKLYRSKQNGLMLFDLGRDPYEDTDVAAENPGIVAEMSEKLESFPRRESVNGSAFSLLLNPETWGGEETRQPWTETVK